MGLCTIVMGVVYQLHPVSEVTLVFMMRATISLSGGY